jgi:hypothetical protein
MADSRTATILSALGVLVAATGVWLTYHGDVVRHEENLRKPEESRPALDIVSASVLKKYSLPDLSNSNWLLLKRPPKKHFKFRLSLVFVIQNHGPVEASDIEISQLRLPNIEPTHELTQQLAVPALQGDPTIGMTTFVQGDLSYKNRLTGRAYSEPWCFKTSRTVEDLTSLVVRLENQTSPPPSIELERCPEGISH